MNDDPRLRTLVLAEDADVQVLEDTGNPRLVPIEARSFAEARHDQLGAWVTIEDGLVTAIEEQWVP